MRRDVRRLAALGLAGAGLAGALAGCGGPSADGGASATSAAPSGATSVAEPTGSPFTATLTGPETASAGQTITVTVTNTGRLPDDFQLDFVPADAATATPHTVSLPAGRSAPIQVQVAVSPFNINLEAGSTGLGNFLDTLEVGSTG